MKVLVFAPWVYIESNDCIREPIGEGPSDAVAHVYATRHNGAQLLGRSLTPVEEINSLKMAAALQVALPEEALRVFWYAWLTRSYQITGSVEDAKEKSDAALRSAGAYLF